MKKLIRNTFVFTLLVLISTTTFGQIEKSDLKILYIGVNPDKALTERDKQRTSNPERAAELRKTRTPDFEQFLKQYFNTVNVVYSEDFKEEMAAKYDVTIIDDYLPVLSGGRKIDPETGKMTYETPKHLSEEYDDATLMIGEPSAFTGQGRQLKIDHLCLCL